MIGLCEECRVPAVGALCQDCLSASEPDVASLRPAGLDEAIARAQRGVALCRAALVEVRAHHGAHS